MKSIPDKDILLFRSCLVSVEYPGVESSTKFVFDKLGIDYAISDKQTCCTGLGHYSDVFDQVDTSAIGARNFKIAKEIGRPNLVMMCATCYAINKKSVKLLNKKDDLRNHINQLFEENGLEHLKYEKDDLLPTENIFHVVDILYNKISEIPNHIKYDLSDYKIATHHGCHYCKVHYEDTIAGFRDPNILDELVSACGCESIGWYDHKRATCGTGFSHIQFDRYQPLISKREGREFKAIHLNIAQFIAIAMGGDFDKVIGVKAHTTPIDSVIKELKEVEK